MKRLSVNEQRALVNAMPAHRMKNVITHCRECEMRGEGVKEIVKSVGKALGSIGKEIGPVVLKELIIPLLLAKGKKTLGMGLKLSGSGLTLPGSGLTLPGGALMLAGQRRGPTQPRVSKSCCQQCTGSGLTLPGSGLTLPGGGLTLPGSGTKKGQVRKTARRAFVKGSQEAKDRMAAMRAMRKKR